MNLIVTLIFAPLNGTMAEWLGKALQKLLQQFESVWYLFKKPVGLFLAGFFRYNRLLIIQLRVMGLQKWIGAFICALLLISCWMHWCYYPDIKQFFTGFYSYNNQYGKPGWLISILAAMALLLHLVPKTWAKAANLAIAAIITAYAVKSMYVYVSPYDGVVPEKQFGIWLMISCIILNLIAVMFAQTGKKTIEEITPTN